MNAGEFGSRDSAIDVSILIVCYKSRADIQKCLEGVIAHTSECRYEILLVDCSGDGTEDFVRTMFPQMRIVSTSENLGFAKGNNFLAAHARGDYLVLLNPDTIVVDNAIGRLYQTAQRFPSAGAIGGRCRTEDGARDRGCRQALPSLGRMMLQTLGFGRFINGALAEEADRESEVEVVSGAFMLVPKHVWQELGGFDPSFFMYSEEVDLCYRLRLSNRPVVMTPHAEIIHLVGGGDIFNANRRLRMARAQMHFLRKHWSRPRWVMGGVVLWLHAMIRWLGGTLLSPLLTRIRAKQLRLGYSAIVWRPARWWRGFECRDGTPSDRQPKSKACDDPETPDARSPNRPTRVSSCHAAKASSTMARKFAEESL